MAFEVWLDHGSEDKKPPEQLPIVLQVRHFAFTLTYKSFFFVKPSLTLYPRYPSLCCYSFNLVKFNIHIPLFNHKKTLILGCVQPAYQKFDVICSGVHRDLTFENVMGRFVPKHIPIII